MQWLGKTNEPAARDDWNVMDAKIEKRAKHYRSRLIKESDLETITTLPPKEMRQTIERLVYRMIEEERAIIPRQEMEALVRQVIHGSVGYGPLEVSLREDDVTEIMVNGPRKVYIERRGRVEETDARFQDEQHIRHIIDRIIAPLGRRIDESSPMVDARLHDGSRVNAVIPPISLNGPVMSIRKFNKDPFTIDDLISFGSFTEEMAEFLRAAVK